MCLCDCVVILLSIFVFSVSIHLTYVVNEHPGSMKSVVIAEVTGDDKHIENMIKGEFRTENVNENLVLFLKDRSDMCSIYGYGQRNGPEGCSYTIT